MTDTKHFQRLAIKAEKSLALKHFNRIAAAQHKVDDAQRALRLLQAMTTAHWRIFASTERRQVYSAIASQLDRIRRLKKKVTTIDTYKKNNPTWATRGNRPECLKCQIDTSLYSLR